VSVLKLPTAALGVVFASRVLPGDAKVLWEKHVYLDRNPEGCRMSAAQMSLLIGRTADFIEVARGKLMRLGLLYKTGMTRTSSWYVVYPSECPLPSGRPTAVEYAAAATVLDAHLRGAGGWNPDSLSGNMESPPINSRSGNMESEVISSPASVVEGGRGVAPQSSSLHKGFPPSAISNGGGVLSGPGNYDGGTGIPSMKEALADLDRRLEQRVTPEGVQPETVR
jgi:hypothetical protein